MRSRSIVLLERGKVGGWSTFFRSNGFLPDGETALATTAEQSIHTTLALEWQDYPAAGSVAW